MNGFSDGFDGGPGGGHDWNGNGHRDSFDGYMDYKVSGSDKKAVEEVTNPMAAMDLAVVRL